ncbi:MAG: carbohydrate ABC transporter permease [Clostridia bacterium]
MKKPWNSDRRFYLVNNIILILFLITVLVPVLYVVAASFSSSAAVVSGKVFLWPVDPTFAGYEGVFRNSQVVTGFINSAIYMIIECVLGVTMTILAAFPLSISHLPGKRLVTFYFTFTMLFSGGLIPSYLLINDLGIYNTIWAVTLPSCLTIYNVILMRSSFKGNIPEELWEAASIDGCGVFRYLFQFVVPLSGAIIAIIALYVSVGSWNSWFNAMIYIKDSALYPLQLILRDILIMNEVDYSMMTPEEIINAQEMQDLLKYSLIVVSTTPMMIIYPFIQKYFVKGLMAGAVKG